MAGVVVRFLPTIAVLLFLSGCASSIPTPQERKERLVSLASEHHLSPSFFGTSPFDLFTVPKAYESCHDKTISIYIEGDGLSWVTRSRISDDPTPINPVGFKLFLADPNPCAVYVARPCQYGRGENCHPQYWTNKRFSDDVIRSYDTLLETLKSKVHNSSFTLIGYSGGGAIAALATARRTDVHKLITVAGNIDTDAWVKLHGLSRLEGSLNPADYAKELSAVDQYHLIGGADTIVPADVFFAYRGHFTDKNRVEYKIYDGLKHSSKWEDIWKSFLKETELNERKKSSKQ